MSEQPGQNLTTVTLNGIDYVVDADFEPGQRMTRDEPGYRDSFDIGQIWEADGVTVAELSDADVERIEAILLERRQASLDAEGYDAYCSRLEE